MTRLRGDDRHRLMWYGAHRIGKGGSFWLLAGTDLETGPPTPTVMPRTVRWYPQVNVAQVDAWIAARFPVEKVRDMFCGNSRIEAVLRKIADADDPDGEAAARYIRRGGGIP